MTVVKRIAGHTVRVGGTQHSGWLPGGAAEPLPTPVRDVTFNIEIDFDGYGYLLCYCSTDGSLYADTWHETLADAEEVAGELFGVRDEQWQAVG
jgi:hypothetical protein